MAGGHSFRLNHPNMALPPMASDSDAQLIIPNIAGIAI